MDGDRTQVAEIGSPDHGGTPIPSDPLLLAGRYRLRELIGRGGVADVHRAVDELLGREVAVKLVRSDSPDPAALERFTAEMRTHAGLSHPNLVTVLDAGTTGARPFLVMELVQGATLADTVTSPSPPEVVAQIGAKVAAGLCHVHERGVVHRDLKPANVLLGDNGRVALSDFGIARLVEVDHGHTAAGFTMGTASYFAPEQVTGSAVTPAADVYSLALVLIEALTGRRVYPGPPAQAALARLQQPPRLPADLPPRLSDLLRRMTADEPGERPDVGEVERELRAVAAGDGGAATVGAATVGTARVDATQVLPPVPVPVPPPAPAPAVPAPAPRPGPSGTTRAEPTRGRRPSAVMLAIVAVLCVIGAVLGAAVVDASREQPAPAEGDQVDEVLVRLDELDRAVNG